MKLFYTFGFFLLFSSNTIAQDSTQEINIVEHLPIYSGCEKKTTEEKRNECTTTELYKFVAKNVKFPHDLKGKRYEGISYVEFSVDITGKIVDSVIVRGFLGEMGSKFDKEALKVVGKIPNMTPGMTLGTPQLVKYIVPVRF